MSFEENLINEVRAHPIVWNKWHEDYKNRVKNDKEWAIIARNLNKTSNEVKSRWRNLRDVFQKELKKARKPRSGDPGSPSSPGIYSGKWTYYHHMTFLKDVMLPRPTQGNYGVNDDEVHSEQSVDWESEIDNSSRTETISILPDERHSTADREDNTVSDDDEPLATIRSRQSASTSSASQGNKRPKQKKSSCSEFETKMLKLEEEKIKAFKEKSNDVDDEDMLFLKSLAPYFRYLSPVKKLRLKSKLQNLIADEIASTTSSSYSTSANSASILPSPVHASMASPPSRTRDFYESFDDSV